jgi:hypothetical protein
VRARNTSTDFVSIVIVTCFAIVLTAPVPTWRSFIQQRPTSPFSQIKKF